MCANLLQLLINEMDTKGRRLSQISVDQQVEVLSNMTPTTLNSSKISDACQISLHIPKMCRWQVIGKNFCHLKVIEADQNVKIRVQKEEKEIDLEPNMFVVSTRNNQNDCKLAHEKLLQLYAEAMNENDEAKKVANEERKVRQKKAKRVREKRTKGRRKALRSMTARGVLVKSRKDKEVSIQSSAVNNASKTSKSVKTRKIKVVKRKLEKLILSFPEKTNVKYVFMQF
jgi:hypothetical protein